MQKLFFLIALVAIFDDGFTQHVRCIHGDHYYFGYPQVVNWFQAEKECHKLGLDLVELKYAALNVAIKSIIKEFKAIKASPEDNGWWTGGRTNTKSRQFYWAGSGDDFKYTDWLVNEPNNGHNDQNCVQIHVNKFQWDDLFCKRYRHYICGPKNIPHSPFIRSVNSFSDHH